MAINAFNQDITNYKVRYMRLDYQELAGILNACCQTLASYNMYYEKLKKTIKMHRNNLNATNLRLCRNHCKFAIANLTRLKELRADVSKYRSMIRNSMAENCALEILMHDIVVKSYAKASAKMFEQELRKTQEIVKGSFDRAEAVRLIQKLTEFLRSDLNDESYTFLFKK